MADLSGARAAASRREDLAEHLATLVSAAAEQPATEHSGTAPRATKSHTWHCEEESASLAAALATEQQCPTLDDASIARRLRGKFEDMHLMARIVDHASDSSSSVSNRVASICSTAGLRTRAELSCDQPIDACGYIAADAVVRLRDSALAETDGWMTTTLPDYSSLASVRRGEAALQRRGAERVLEVADVNALARHYSHLDAHPHAHEEWWAAQWPWTIYCTARCATS